ncbi:MAG: ImmA/IrrE family metallo-endopeptidase [bacterium]
MKRGFKSQSELISKRYRKALGLTLEEALPYKQIADHLNVRIWEPRDIPGLEKSAIAQLSKPESEWSAATLEANGTTLIIVNSAHSEARRANDVLHELAHIILGHSKGRLDVSDDGHLWLKSYGLDQEEEADWLSATMLLPRDGLLALYRRFPDHETIAEIYGVSPELVKMRVNLTGISKQVRN